MTLSCTLSVGNDLHIWTLPPCEEREENIRCRNKLMSWISNWMECHILKWKFCTFMERRQAWNILVVSIQEGRHCSWMQFSRPTTKILIHIDTEKHYYLQLTLMFTCTWAYTSRVSTTQQPHLSHTLSVYVRRTHSQTLTGRVSTDCQAHWICRD